MTRKTGKQIDPEPISTHTLTWSVTGWVFAGFHRIFISTHTLTWSVTQTTGYWDYQTAHFNSHAHVERDAPYLTSCRCNHEISTHTLTWSVTCWFFDEFWTKRNFNSHAHVERDKNSSLKIHTTEISTHTLTWSVTICIIHWFKIRVHFNSHAHVERDNSAGENIQLLYAFQLTRSRGAWLGQGCTALDIAHFNSHAHVERDP